MNAKRISAIAAAVLVSAATIAAPAQAAAPSNWQDRKMAQTVLRDVWRNSLTPADRAAICDGYNNGYDWIVVDPLVETIVTSSDFQISFSDARYVVIRFFNSAC